MKELTDEQLKAIAEATGSESLLDEVEAEAPKVGKASGDPVAAAVDMIGNVTGGKGPDEETVDAIGNVASGKGGKNPVAAILNGEGPDEETVSAAMNLLGNLTGGKKKK